MRYKINWNGEILSVAEICRREKISVSAVYARQEKTKEDFIDVINYYINYEGQYKFRIGDKYVPFTEYCNYMGYNYNNIMSIKSRYKITHEEAIEKYLENKNKRISKSARLRGIWRNMIYRCYNPNNHAYKWYGERGIRVQDSWKNDYFAFEDDLYNDYVEHVKEFGEEDTTLDRIDYNGNYELNNVRWVTMKEQANNRRNNFIVVDNLTLAQFSEKYNLPVGIVWYRIHHGWTIEKIINTPIKNYNTFIFSTGETKAEVAKRLGISRNTLERKLNKGLTLEEIESIHVKKYNNYYLPCNRTLRQHCIINNYDYSLITSYYIRKCNLSPDEALARYLKNRKKKNK